MPKLLIQAARGLAAVHRAGFAHGDVKPWNLLVGRDDRVYVADFSVTWRLAGGYLLASLLFAELGAFVVWALYQPVYALSGQVR